MLSCITCAKQTDERGDGGGGGRVSSPSTDESVKSLTTQIKGMALKFSGACKPSSSGGFKKGDRSYHDFDTASEGTPYPSYMHAGNSTSTSTSAWDFPNRGVGGGRSLSRLASGYGVGGERIQAGRESVCTESDVFLEDEEEPKEWMAQVEPGVHITFVSLPNGGNDLKRIRFSREMFNKWQAQRWWGENYDRIMELYNVQRFNRQALNTPARSEDEPRDSSYTRLGSPRMTPSLQKDWIPQHSYKPPSDYGGGGGSSSAYYGPPGGGGGARCDTSSVDASRTTTSSRDEAASVSISNASELETEWVEQDDPGVYITIRQLADGSRELRRVRFSRERFGEVHAKLWWEQNRERIQAQYL